MTSRIPSGETYAVAVKTVGGADFQRTQGVFGGAGEATDVSDATPYPVGLGAKAELFEAYEDTSFLTGDSPVVLDLNTDLGRNARHIEIDNDGAGDFTFAISNDGAAYSSERSMSAGERLVIEGLSIDSVRITWVGNSAYRVLGY